MRRPSQNLPVGFLKYDCPLGSPGRKPSPAANSPVSEFESPKLKIAG